MLNVIFCTFLAGLKRIVWFLKTNFFFFQLINSITMEELQEKYKKTVTNP